MYKNVNNRIKACQSFMDKSIPYINSLPKELRKIAIDETYRLAKKLLNN